MLNRSSKKMQTITRSDARKLAEKLANDRGVLGKMSAVAIHTSNKLDNVVERSGLPMLGSFYESYLIEYAGDLPWRSSTQRTSLPFTTCAEAHLWCELIARGKDPKKYILFAFNAGGRIASPCDNCQEWVRDAFKEVYQETTIYHPARQGTA